MMLMALQQADEALFRRLIAWERPSFVQLARLLSRTADGWCYPLVALLACWWRGAEGSAFLLMALCAFVIERPLYLVLKHSLRRHRPAERLGDVCSVVIPSDRFSLPSGHTAAAFLMATLLSVFWPILALPAFVWAALVGWSRVMLRVHFPADVVVGAMMGTSVALSVFSMLA